MRKLRMAVDAVIDTQAVIMIGVVFAAIMVFAYLIWEIYTTFLTAGGEAPGSTAWPWNAADDPTGAINASMNATWDAEQSVRLGLGNVTGGFDNAVNLLLVAITIFILAIAISALLLLRRGR